jgi:hypothetical protein
MAQSGLVLLLIVKCEKQNTTEEFHRTELEKRGWTTVAHQLDSLLEGLYTSTTTRERYIICNVNGLHRANVKTPVR